MRIRFAPSENAKIGRKITKRRTFSWLRGSLSLFVLYGLRSSCLLLPISLETIFGCSVLEYRFPFSRISQRMSRIVVAHMRLDRHVCARVCVADCPQNHTDGVGFVMHCSNRIECIVRIEIGVEFNWENLGSIFFILNWFMLQFIILNTLWSILYWIFNIF